MAQSGKVRRLSRLFNRNTNRILVVPLDDSLIAGPEMGLRKPQELLREIRIGGADAIMGFKGLIRRHAELIRDIGTIVNATASTTLGAHTRKVLVTTVEEVLSLDADAVGAHVNVGSQFETEMLNILSLVSRECDRYGMPLIGIMYPRAERNGFDYNYEDVFESDPDQYARIVRHACRVGVELGVDIIKTQYTGSVESFGTVIDSCCGIPVIIAGGPTVVSRKMLTKAEQAVRAGAAGISFGRNVFNRRVPSKYVAALRLIVHESMSAEKAMEATGIDPESTF